jgi:hypothetical protein
VKRLYVYCEGQAEEGFVNAVLAPYFLNVNVFVTPIVAGGVSKYSIIKNDLVRICKGDPQSSTTTMLDYYGLPSETPGIATASGTIYEKAQHIEAAVEKDLGILENLLFNLVVHEYEGLLFAHTPAFEVIANKKQITALKSIRERFDTPEHINNSFENTPSRRIERIIPTYSKVNDGIEVARCTGINGISVECKHFERWITKLTSWANQAG